ncbi:glycosyltransferase [Streptacidiphilus fuscans]|uniref:Glycosyltransferase n=1 Tax=Streptacidiphilus fuscans TaxID=2789292 RepID=A0A931B6I7_9ACTN|nr:glycosyltransferase [Streptacidiphilus fuscans]MBF9071334.1 glycosyltransferase [Streptacidiphilus fuscans]
MVTPHQLGTERPLRVLHVITGLRAGGAEQQLRLLLRHLPATGPGAVHCEVVQLCASGPEPGTVAVGLRADGITVHELGMRGNRDLAALPRLVRLIRDGRYDVVHCHLYRACLYGRLAARLAGVRAVVATEHSLQPGVLEGRRTGFGVRRLYLAGERLGTTTIAVSEAVADQLRVWGVRPGRIRIVPNGIEPDAYRVPAASRATTRAALGLPEDAYVVGGVGRLVPGKRFDVLVEALALLPDDVRLLLVGAGPARASLLGLARARGVADRVVLTGERDDVPALLGAMDVLAAPSDGETFGLALVEALAAGLPVLWSSGPALTELPVMDQRALTRQGSARTEPKPQAYAAALDRLRGTRADHRDPPRAVVTRYDIARLAPRVAAVYAEAVGEPGRLPSERHPAELPAAPQDREASPKEMTRA